METKALAQAARLIAAYKQRAMNVRSINLLDGQIEDPVARELLHYADWTDGNPLLMTDRAMSLTLMLRDNRTEISRLREQAQASDNPAEMATKAVELAEQMEAALALLEGFNGR